MKKYGYKKGIHLGLTFYSLGMPFSNTIMLHTEILFQAPSSSGLQPSIANMEALWDAHSSLVTSSTLELKTQHLTIAL